MTTSPLGRHGSNNNQPGDNRNYGNPSSGNLYNTSVTSPMRESSIKATGAFLMSKKQ
jgi:hypothetical protein